MCLLFFIRRFHMFVFCNMILGNKLGLNMKNFISIVIISVGLVTTIFGQEFETRTAVPSRGASVLLNNVSLFKPEAFKLDQKETKGQVNTQENSYIGARRVSLGTVITNISSNVFFIQLSAFNGNGAQDFDKFRSLLKFGNIYKIFVGTSTKIRLGYFINELEARDILRKVKDNGFSDAFMVSNPLNTSNMELVLSSLDSKPNTTEIDNAATSKNNTTTTNNPITTPAPDYGSNVMYKVRLASYEDPIWFDSKKVSDIGKLEQWSKGTWTIFVLSGFKNYEEAEKARIKSVNRGFGGAEVVVDNGGIIETIKKN